MSNKLKNEGMNRETTSKVHKGQQGANPKMRMLVYRERSYPARKVQGRDGSYTVAADSLVPELLDGIRSLDPAAFKLDEENRLLLLGRGNPKTGGRRTGRNNL